MLSIDGKLGVLVVGMEHIQTGEDGIADLGADIALVLPHAHQVELLRLQLFFLHISTR